MADYDKEPKKEETVKEQGEYTPSVATDFLRETIKQKPVNKKKLLRRTITTVIMAVVFGMVACLTFLILQPVVNSWLNPEPPAELIEFPEEEEEVDLGEFYLDDNQMKEEELEEIRESTVIDNAEKVQAMLDNIVLDTHDYETMYSSIKALTKEVEKSVVTVTGVTEDVDWFQNTYQNERQSSGVIVAENGKAYLVVVKNAGFETAGSVWVTFCDGTEAEAECLGIDETTGIAVVSVPFTGILIHTKEVVKIANLGTSNGVLLRGTPVVAIGSPCGTNGSVNYGILTSEGIPLDLVDSNYKLLTTNISGAGSASGILVSMKGYVIGIIENGFNSNDTGNMLSAYGISELKKMIEKLSNGEPRAYLGIHATDVPTSVQNELKVPKGVYVTGVEMNSPAMAGGIQKGDIITYVRDQEIVGYREVISVLNEMNPEDVLRIKAYRQAAEGYAEIDLEITLGEMQ